MEKVIGIGIIIGLLLVSGCVTPEDPEGTVRCYQCQDNQEVSQLFQGETCPQGWYPDHQDCSGSLYEDLTTYTKEYDTGSFLTVTPTMISFVDLPGYSNARLLKQMDYNYFDLTYNFTVLDYDSPTGTDVTSPGMSVVFSKVPNASPGHTTGQESISIGAWEWRSPGGTLYRCIIMSDCRRPWNENTDFCQFLETAPFDPSITYTMHVYKVGSQINLDIYKNGVWVYSDFLELEVTSASGEYHDMSFNYFYPFIGANRGGSSHQTTATFSDYIFSAL